MPTSSPSSSLSSAPLIALAVLWPVAALAQSPAPAADTAPPVTAAPPPASPAAAQPTVATPPDAPDTNVSTMNNTLSIFGSIGYGYGYGAGYGLGARYQVRLVDRLLRLPPGKHDELGLEFGLDWYHVGYEYKVPGFSYDWSYNEFTPVVGVTWNFWLTEQLALYPKLDFGYRFISWNDDVLNGYDPAVGHLYFQGTGGIIYSLGKVRLRAELGWASIRLGAGIQLF